MNGKPAVQYFTLTAPCSANSMRGSRVPTLPGCQIAWARAQLALLGKYKDHSCLNYELQTTLIKKRKPFQAATELHTNHNLKAYQSEQSYWSSSELVNL